LGPRRVEDVDVFGVLDPRPEHARSRTEGVAEEIEEWDGLAQVEIGFGSRRRDFIRLTRVDLRAKVKRKNWPKNTKGFSDICAKRHLRERH
jgi:hypothetical protein